MIVSKYKDSFCDLIGDSVIGSGYESLLKQMEERIANLNRKSGKDLVKLNISSEDEDSEPKSKSRKTVIRDSYGCVNWKSKQDWLIEEFRKKEQDKKKVLLFMKETYTSQQACLLMRTLKIILLLKLKINGLSFFRRIVCFFILSS